MLVRSLQLCADKDDYIMLLTMARNPNPTPKDCMMLLIMTLDPSPYPNRTPKDYMMLLTMSFTSMRGGMFDGGSSDSEEETLDEAPEGEHDIVKAV